MFTEERRGRATTLSLNISDELLDIGRKRLETIDAEYDALPKVRRGSSKVATKPMSKDDFIQQTLSEIYGYELNDREFRLLFSKLK